MGTDRVMRWVAVVLVVLALLQPVSTGATASAEPTRLLDLAWVTLPEPGGPERVPALGQASGYQRFEETALSLGGQGSDWEDAARAAWVQGYAGTLGWEMVDDPDRYRRTVAIRVNQFTSEDAAGEAVKLLAISGHEGAVGSIVIQEYPGRPGVQQQVYRTVVDDAAAEHLRAIAVVGALQLDIEMTDWMGIAPREADLLPFLDAAVARAERVGARPDPALSLSVYRPGGEGITTWHDRYERADGISYAHDGTAFDDPGVTELWYAERGVQSHYQVLATSGWDPARGMAEEYLAVNVYQFDNPTAAMLGQASLFASWLADPGLMVVDHEIIAGEMDGASAQLAGWYITTHQMVSYRGYRIWQVVGSTLVSIDVTGSPGVLEAGVGTIADLAAGCAEVSCPGWQPVPDPLLADSPVSALPGHVGTGDDTTPLGPTDLPWVAARPEELPEAGWESWPSSGWETMEQAAGSATQEGSAEYGHVLEVLSKGGWLQTYRGVLALEDPENTGQLARITMTRLTEFETETGARNLYHTLLAQTYMAAGFGRSAQAATIGDESRYFSASLGSGEQGRGYPTAVLLAVDGNVVIELYLVDLEATSKFPFLREADEVLNPIGEAITARLEEARAGEAPGLGLMVLRFGVPGSIVQRTRYTALDGEMIGRTTPVGEPVESFEGFLHRQGVVDGFFSQILIPAEGEGRITMNLELFRFASEAQASAYVRERVWTLQRQGDSGRIVQGSPDVGEESAMVRWKSLADDGQLEYWVSEVVRVGTLTSEILIGSATEVSDAEMARLIENAGRCLSEGDCIRVDQQTELQETGARSQMSGNQSQVLVRFAA